MKKVFVASTNPVKINAVEIGFAKMFPEMLIKIEGESTPSNVSDQPLSEEETLKGAINRVENVSKLKPTSDYWVGIEGGLQEVGREMEAFAWIVVKAKNGKELGEADDIVFGRTNSKQANGAVGILTNDTITRTTYYEQAMILALIPFKNPKLY